MKITHINKKLKIIKSTNEHFYKKAGISILIILLSSVYHSFAFLSCRFENLNKSTIIDYSSRNSMISDLSMSTLPNSFWYFLRSFHKCLFLLVFFYLFFSPVTISIFQPKKISFVFALAIPQIFCTRSLFFFLCCSVSKSFTWNRFIL